VKGRLLTVLSLILATSSSCNNIGVDKQQTPPPPIVDILTPPKEPKEYEGFTVIEEGQDPYRCVGQVYDKDHVMVGSAVQITETIVLTAGHCIDGTNLMYFRVGETDYVIKEQILHPRFKIGENIVNDIGILILQEKTCITKLPEITYDKSNLTRYEELTTIGFSHCIKKKSNPGSFYYFGIVLEDPFEFKFNSTKGAHVWFGDSGGAVFEDTGKLCGLISSFRLHDLTITEMSATPLFYHKEWIKKTIEEHKPDRLLGF
jgi:hypothetical protein